MADYDMDIVHGHFVRAWGEPPMRSVSLLIGTRTPTGIYYAEKVEMPLEDDQTAHVQQPSMYISPPAAQLLMDDLWRAGLRPSEGSGSAGALRAVERHLDDMRQIAFNKLKIEVLDHEKNRRIR